MLLSLQSHNLDPGLLRESTMIKTMTLMQLLPCDIHTYSHYSKVVHNQFLVVGVMLKSKSFFLVKIQLFMYVLVYMHIKIPNLNFYIQKMNEFYICIPLQYSNITNSTHTQQCTEYRSYYCRKQYKIYLITYYLFTRL